MFAEWSQTLATVYFSLFALIALACGLGVLFVRHPIKGAVCLVGVMLSLAGIYALLHSPFLAVLQVLVYAGAIMMLLVFVIMILNQAEDHAVPRFDRLSLAGLILPLLVAAAVIATLRSTGLAEAAGTPRIGLGEMAANLFNLTGSGWYILFEIGGLLLLAAVVAAILLAKRSLERNDEPAELTAAHGGHADRGAALAEVDDHAAAAQSTVALRAPEDL